MRVPAILLMGIVLSACVSSRELPSQPVPPANLGSTQAAPPVPPVPAGLPPGYTRHITYRDGRFTLPDGSTVPADPNGAWYTSGVRIGTPALTTRGFGAEEFDKVAELIVTVLKNTSPVIASSGQPGKAKYVLADGVAEATKAASAELLDANPLYPGLAL